MRNKSEAELAQAQKEKWQKEWDSIMEALAPTLSRMAYAWSERNYAKQKRK